MLGCGNKLHLERSLRVLEKSNHFCIPQPIMSKNPPPYSGDAPTDDLPPPYTASTTSSSSSSQGLLTSHLSTLRAHAEITRDVDDSRLLARISDSIEELLTSVLAKSQKHQNPRVIEAIAVPSSAINSQWELSDTEDRESGKLARIVSVEIREKGSGDEKKQPQDSQSTDGEWSARDASRRGFDAWGRWNDDAGRSSDSDESMLWWNDESLAKRLARYLHPPQAPQAMAGSSSTAATRMEGAVSMTARAEEATFRRENEMGLWESKTGWAIMVRFRF